MLKYIYLKIEYGKSTEISLSVLKGDKLFDDKKTPFVIKYIFSSTFRRRKKI